MILPVPSGNGTLNTAPRGLVAGTSCGQDVLPDGLSGLTAGDLLRFNLLTYRDLWVWLDQPYQTPALGTAGRPVIIIWMRLGQQKMERKRNTGNLNLNIGKNCPKQPIR